MAKYKWPQRQHMKLRWYHTFDFRPWLFGILICAGLVAWFLRYTENANHLEPQMKQLQREIEERIAAEPD